METPLTPLEFARRARKVYPEQIAVIDGESRWSYAQFLDRCDRWSAVLQRLGVGAGDRVAYLAPNTHAQLESFYSVPQLGAVLVPLNFRLTADDFLYLINHSGARVVCAHRDYLEAINNIRSHLPCVEHFVALTGEANDWLNYEALLQASSAEFVRPEIHETDLLTINYTSGTTARPKGVMITHRNAWMNSIGTLAPCTHDLCRSLSVDTADVSRERLDLRLDGYRRRRDTRLSAQDRTARDLRINGERADNYALRRADRINLVSECAGGYSSPCAEEHPSCHRRRAARRVHHPKTRRRTGLDDYTTFTDSPRRRRSSPSANSGRNTRPSRLVSERRSKPGKASS